MLRANPASTRRRSGRFEMLINLLIVIPNNRGNPGCGAKFGVLSVGQTATNWRHEMSGSSYPERKFNKQFVIGPEHCEILPGWVGAAAPNGQRITYHPKLHMESCEGPKARLVCLGDVFDATDPSRTNHDIVQSIAASSTSFADFEDETSTLSGRWVMLVRIGDETRLYPDATGQKPIYYTDTGQDLWIGAQPSLLAEALTLAVNQDRVSCFLDNPHYASWPGLVTPYDDLFQLWPNHYLDLDAGKSHRFWPNAPLTPLDAEQCARRSVDYLSNIMQAAANRAPLHLWLTGGFDSRVIFAASKALHGAMNFGVFDYFAGDSYDITISRSLARKSGRPVQLVRPKRASPAFWELLRTNTGQMSLEAANILQTAFTEMPGDLLHIAGTVGEVGRCFYYKDGVKPGTIDPDTLTRLAHYPGNPVAHSVFTEWFEGVQNTVAPDCGIDVLDLFYWEHRLGAWLGVQSLANDSFIDTLAPFNCRALLSTMLSANVEQRTEPYRLFRKMCEIAYPEVLEEPFNWSRRWQFEQQFRSMLPWRVRNWANQIQSSRLGMSYQ